MLLHLPVGLSSRQTAQRRLLGAHNDRSQSHRQWLAVTAPAGRAYAVERVRLTCRREPRCCQTKQVPKKGVEGRRREARRRPKKLRFIGRHQKALAHPSLLPLNNYQLLGFKETTSEPPNQLMVSPSLGRTTASAKNTQIGDFLRSHDSVFTSFCFWVFLTTLHSTHDPTTTTGCESNSLRRDSIQPPAFEICHVRGPEESTRVHT